MGQAGVVNTSGRWKVYVLAFLLLLGGYAAYVYVDGHRNVRREKFTGGDEEDDDEEDEDEGYEDEKDEAGGQATSTAGEEEGTSPTSTSPTSSSPTSTSPTSTSPTSSSTPSGTTSSQATYESRMRVMKLFEVLLQRSATDQEVERYGVLEKDTAILDALIRDYALLPGYAAFRESSSTASTSREEEGTADPALLPPSSSASSPSLPPPTERQAPSSPPPPFPPAHGTGGTEPTDDYAVAPSASARAGGAAHYTLGPEDQLTTTTSMFEPMTIGSDSSGSSITLDKADVLRRLSSISRDINQFYHLVSAY